MKADSINISACGEQNVYEDKVAALMADARVHSLGYKEGAFVLVRSCWRLRLELVGLVVAGQNLRLLDHRGPKGGQRGRTSSRWSRGPSSYPVSGHR